MGIHPFPLLVSFNHKTAVTELMRRLEPFCKRRQQHAQRTGPIWQRVYYDHGLRRDEDLHPVVYYLIANPLHARLATPVGGWISGHGPAM